MGKDLGILLRSLREACGMPVERVADKASIEPSTLYRWEQGKTEPQMKQLKAVLEALAVSQQMRQKAFLLLEAPRGMHAVRSTLSPGHCLHDSLLAIGDVLRAMRMRSGKTGRQLAQALGVHPSTVTRWERSECTIPADHVEQLCKILNSFPEERVALSGSRLAGVAFPLEQRTSLEACEQYLEELVAEMSAGAVSLADLRFITLEAQLWPMALRRDDALRVLVLAWIHHADFLLWQGRIEEMSRYSWRALEVAQERLDPEDYWLKAVGQCSQITAQKQGARGAKEALALLETWREFAKGFDQETELYRGMAEYSIGARHPDEALDLIKLSRSKIQREEDVAWSTRAANIIEARAYLARGQYARAEPLLAAEDAIHPYQRLIEIGLLVDAALGRKDRAAAGEWLRQYYALVDIHGLEHQRVHGDTLARRL